MKTVASISGGQTSNFMYMNYDFDYYIFALVSTTDPKTAPKDKGLLREIQKRLPDFVGSVESDLTLKNLLNIEQERGREIVWTKGIEFDKLIEYKKALPNQMWRFCTQEMKMKPIFEYILKYILEGPDDKILMPLGIRADESIRAHTITANNVQGYQYPVYASLTGQRRQRWKTYHYRDVCFPLINDKVTKKQIQKYWLDKGYLYPVESNCVGCFHKSPSALQDQFKHYPEKMQFFVDMENKIGSTFKKEFAYNDLKSMAPKLFTPEKNTSMNCNCTD